MNRKAVIGPCGKNTPEEESTDTRYSTDHPKILRYNRQQRPNQRGYRLCDFMLTVTEKEKLDGKQRGGLGEWADEQEGM